MIGCSTFEEISSYGSAMNIVRNIESDVKMEEKIPIVNRDPNNLNCQVKVAFDDLIGEPEGYHSFNCVWKLSYHCFEFWKNLCYKLTTLLCAACCATKWGCEFGCLTCFHVWYITPLYKMTSIICGCLQKFWTLFVNCLIEPCCHACSQCFIAFKKN